jgi:alkanesulfonate monooxygenase SsuD/methylene tetrahydromethanopterin reductase-like flavin-dependent oxidoreductase (luciferase family)
VWEFENPDERPPLGAGTVALGLHPSPGEAGAVLQGLRAQAAAADRAGFDGVTLSEHHGGFPGYLPVPTLVAATLLAVMPRAWAAPCPTILPLRDATAVVEELAWLGATHPGRLGVGFVPGYQARDFAVIGRDFSRRRQQFDEALPWATAALAGRVTGELDSDPAVRALATAAIPVVSGTVGPRSARRAAEAGAGLLLTSLMAADRAGALVDAYRSAGGTRPCVLIRRAWVGVPPDSVRRQLARYHDADSDSALAEAPDRDIVVHGDPAVVASSLATDCLRSHADALNLRVFAEDASQETLLEQVDRFGAEVLPALRRTPGWGPRAGNSP